MAILGRITGDINVFLADDEIFLRNACRESFSDYAIIINDKKNCDEYYLNMTFESKAGVWEAQFPLITDNNFSTLGVGRVRKTNRNKPVFKDLVDRRWVQ